MSYEKLFEPGMIGNLELKNRIVMPAMGCSLAESTGEAGARMIKYYADRARGGAGLIITEITRVDDETGVGTPNQLSVTNTHMIAQLSRLAEAVHAYDTKIFVQLHHPGNQTPSRLIGGKQPVSASDVTCKVIGEQPRALTTEEVEAMVRKFVTGAVIAQKSGIDGVEIHAAHGYLVSQFLSPHTNKRTDKYGGSFEGRMRFITEIIMGIKAYCGPKFPISVRMNGSDYLPDGITEEDGIAQAKYLEALGISCINVSCGRRLEDQPRCQYSQGCEDSRYRCLQCQASCFCREDARKWRCRFCRHRARPLGRSQLGQKSESRQGHPDPQMPGMHGVLQDPQRRTTSGVHCQPGSGPRI